MFADSFRPADVKVLGALDYGDTSAPVECGGGTEYCGYVFNGAGGDQIQVTVKGGEQKPFVAVADGSLKELARGEGTVSLTLPNKGPDIEAYYIVFRGENNQARLTVHLAKHEGK